VQALTYLSATCFILGLLIRFLLALWPF